MCAHCGRSHGGDICPATGRATSEPGPCGTRIDRYEVLERIGGGGFGTVYRAAHVHTLRAVALKLLDPELADDSTALARFKREAQVATAIDSPHVVDVLDWGVLPTGHAFLVMELLDGHDLAAILAAEGALPVGRAQEIADQLLAGLDAVHARGALHRDVKPGNVFLARHDSREVVKLLDFGCARPEHRGDEPRASRSGTTIGTPRYMAPEQLRGLAIDARCDVYAAATVVYEMLSGRVPHEGTSYEDTVIRVCTEAPRPLAEVAPGTPREVAAAVMRGLEREPARRWPSVAEFAQALRGDVPAAPTVSSRRLVRPRRRRGIAWAIAVAVVGAIVTATTIGSNRGALEAPARGHGSIDEAWRIAQHGGHEYARDIVDELVDARSQDPRVGLLAVLVHWWIGTTRVDKLVEDAEALRLSPGQRGLLHGVKLLHTGREAEAVIAMQAEEARHPGTAEIAYALGEARWHAGDRAGGVAELETALRRDPGWQMALHHAVDFHVARGEVAAVRELAALVASSDPAAEQALAVTALIAERRYAAAATTARDALARFPDDAALWQHRASAEVLLGNLDAAQRSADRALELWPRDERGAGAFARWAELALYRGDEAGFEQAIGGRFSPANLLRLALWHGGTGLPEDRPNRDGEGPRRISGQSGMSAPPLYQCVQLLGADHHGLDASPFWTRSPDAEVRSFGAGLVAQRAGDLGAAEAHFAAGLDAALADTRPLLAYYLARVRAARGNASGAAAACDEVLRPRGYVTYRAVLLRDCLAWTQDD